MDRIEMRLRIIETLTPHCSDSTIIIGIAKEVEGYVLGRRKIIRGDKK